MRFAHVDNDLNDGLIPFDKAPLRSKMQYSTWNTQVAQSLETGGISNIVQATGRDEIEESVVV